MEVSGECMALLLEAVRWAGITGGAFDLTIGPLVKLWQLELGKRSVPRPESIARCLDLVNYCDLQLDERRLSARLRKTGQLVDLGGIAKGCAGDQAAAVYRAHYIQSAFINLGGNVVVVGGQVAGSSWRVGVQHPRRRAGDCLGVIHGRDESLVTSGDYERYYRRGRTRYHHIIDPRTGDPSRSGLISVTVVHQLSMAADVLSTAVLVLGLDAGLELIRATAGAKAVLVTSDLEVYVTPGPIRSLPAGAGDGP